MPGLTHGFVTGSGRQTQRWQRLVRHPALVIGGIIVSMVVLMALLAPALATHDPTKTALARRLEAPGQAGHLLGTDDFGRDVWSRLVFGARISLRVGLESVVIGLGFGLVAGLLAGFYGGSVDMVIGRVLDVILAFPGILLALAIVAALGPSLTSAIVAIGVTAIPRFALVTRGVVLSLREREFVLAARALGAPAGRILWREILPNTLSPVIVVASLSIATAILLEASLSFLGLGVSPPTPTWGSMIADGRAYMDSAPWIAGFSGLFIMVTVLGFNLLGDGLRDALDPRLRPPA